jgi:hypothetical protein
MHAASIASIDHGEDGAKDALAQEAVDLAAAEFAEPAAAAQAVGKAAFVKGSLDNITGPRAPPRLTAPPPTPRGAEVRGAAQ